MYCLFLDMALTKGIFALFCNGIVCEEYRCDLIEARQPIRVMHRLLQNKGLTLDDISFVGSGIGPGSYTGIRSTWATVKGIALCTGKQIVSVSSLLQVVPEEKGAYLIVVSDKIGGAYGQKVFFDGISYSYEEPCLISLEELRSVSDKELISSSDVWLKGEGISVRVVSSHTQVIAQVVYQNYCEGKGSDGRNTSLTYLRKTYAESSLLIK